MRGSRRTIGAALIIIVPVVTAPLMMAPSRALAGTAASTQRAASPGKGAGAPPAASPGMAAELPTLHHGALEVGLSGSLTTTDGIASGMLGVRGGLLLNGLHGLVGVELDVAYRHIGSLDVYDFGIQGTWQRRLGRTGTYPFLAIGFGIRAEDVGSFRLNRYPVGFGAGLRTLFGQRAAIRVEYAFRRILDDPVANFSEHRVLVGLSIFFRNQRPQS